MSEEPEFSGQYMYQKRYGAVLSERRPMPLYSKVVVVLVVVATRTISVVEVVVISVTNCVLSNVVVVISVVVNGVGDGMARAQAALISGMQKVVKGNGMVRGS